MSYPNKRLYNGSHSGGEESHKTWEISEVMRDNRDNTMRGTIEHHTMIPYKYRLTLRKGGEIVEQWEVKNTLPAVYVRIALRSAISRAMDRNR